MYRTSEAIPSGMMSSAPACGWVRKRCCPRPTPSTSESESEPSLYTSFSVTSPPTTSHHLPPPPSPPPHLPPPPPPSLSLLSHTLHAHLRRQRTPTTTNSLQLLPLFIYPRSPTLVAVVVTAKIGIRPIIIAAIPIPPCHRLEHHRCLCLVKQPVVI